MSALKRTPFAGGLQLGHNSDNEITPYHTPNIKHTLDCPKYVQILHEKTHGFGGVSFLRDGVLPLWTFWDHTS